MGILVSFIDFLLVMSVLNKLLLLEENNVTMSKVLLNFDSCQAVALARPYQTSLWAVHSRLSSTTAIEVLAREGSTRELVLRALIFNSPDHNAVCGKGLQKCLLYLKMLKSTWVTVLNKIKLRS